MADLTTFKGLCEAVADYLGREDLTERIPTFIRLAEQRMNRELRLRVMERRAETEVKAGQSAVPHQQLFAAGKSGNAERGCAGRIPRLRTPA